ncbi:MAG: fasciclin domain-containing protein [Acidimicrobiia bacterium]
MNKQLWKVVAAAGIVAVAAVGCSSSSKSEDTTTTAAESSSTTAAMGKETVVAIAAGNPDFSTLVSFVKEAGLVDTLSGPGPFTVFAPTNEAFAKVPPAVVAKLKANPELLKKVLTYHVYAGKALAADVTKLPGVDTPQGATIKMVDGTPLTVKVSGGKVTLTDATGQVVNVTKTDIEGSNGVIHVIDGVLLPAAP